MYLAQYHGAASIGSWGKIACVADTTAKFRDHKHKTGQMARFMHFNVPCQGESRPPVAQALAAVFLRVGFDARSSTGTGGIRKNESRTPKPRKRTDLSVSREYSPATF